MIADRKEARDMKTFTAITAMAFAIGSCASPALAGQSSAAWGTLASGGTSTGVASATLHRLEGQNAQATTIGNQITSMYKSITSCGYCVYNQITGDSNSINGNTITGSNSGTVTANGTFKN